MLVRTAGERETSHATGATARSAGVKEYRIADPAANVVIVYRLKEEGGGYEKPCIHEGKGVLKVNVPEGLEIDPDQWFAF